MNSILLIGINPEINKFCVTVRQTKIWMEIEIKIFEMKFILTTILQKREQKVTKKLIKDVDR
jgi:hypothetical protein